MILQSQCRSSEAQKVNLILYHCMYFCYIIFIFIKILENLTHNGRQFCGFESR
jgi:hypothetical protein